MAEQIYAANIAKRSLSAHSWLGLMASAVLYLICLTGTVAVLHQEFERWEQPGIEETQGFTIAQVEQAFTQFSQRYDEETKHYHVVFPGSGIPRLVMEDDHTAHFVDSRGNLVEKENVTWSQMLVNLHMYLHLPKSIGMIVVSIFGALLCALVVSGLVAYPRIIKDAFRFRLGGDGQKTHIDLHNRLSVWGLPFHLMIAVSGAYFGLASILLLTISQAFYQGDQQAVVDKVFTAEPQLEQPIMAPDIGTALSDMLERVEPEQLIFLTVHEPGTPQQFLEFYVSVPGRLIYSENYRYDAKGQFIGTAGYQYGDGGKQIIYSMYRLHFGSFMGLSSKVLYVVLGFMLTVVCATGFTIWLNKRKTRDALNLIWPGLVWGGPCALVISALAYFALGLSPSGTFWISLIILAGSSLMAPSQRHVTVILRYMLAAFIVALNIVYIVKFDHAAWHLPALQVNLPLLLLAIWACYSAARQSVLNLHTPGTSAFNSR